MLTDPGSHVKYLVFRLGGFLVGPVLYSVSFFSVPPCSLGPPGYPFSIHASSRCLLVKMVRFAQGLALLAAAAASVQAVSEAGTFVPGAYIVEFEDNHVGPASLRSRRLD